MILTRLQSSSVQLPLDYTAENGCRPSVLSSDCCLHSSLPHRQPMSLFPGELRKLERYGEIFHRLSLLPKQSSHPLLHLSYLDVNVISVKKLVTCLSFTEELELSVVCLLLSFLVSLKPTPESCCLKHPTEPLLMAESVVKS